MNRAGRFTRSELTNIAIVAREQHVAVRLNSDGSLTVYPDPPKLDPIDDAGEADLDRELEEFRAKHGKG